MSSNFGKYRLIAELGHGGMADVFLAVAEGPEDFNKLVVVKRIRDNLAEDPLFIDMIVDEARLAARLSHPNTIQTFDVGQADGRWFIAMEFLDGQPLSRLLTTARGSKNSPLPLPHALTILIDVLNGLDHAHELRDYDGSHLHVVHRDVSPQNIFVTYDGHAKIVDFGIAKARGRNVQTTGGTIKGKVSYMAPEQVVAAAEVDRRADVFAAGVVLWEILAGRRMWQGHDDIAIMSCLISGVLPEGPRSIAPSTPPELEAICRRALSHDRNKRHPTARALAEDLIAYLQKTGETVQRHELGSFVSNLFAQRRRAMREVLDGAVARLTSPRSSRRLSATSPTSGVLSNPNRATSGADDKDDVLVDLTSIDVTFTESLSAPPSSGPVSGSVPKRSGVRRSLDEPDVPAEPSSTAGLVMPATTRRPRGRLLVASIFSAVAVVVVLATLFVVAMLSERPRADSAAAADQTDRRKVVETLGSRPLATDPATPSGIVPMPSSRPVTAPHVIDSAPAIVRAAQGLRTAPKTSAATIAAPSHHAPPTSEPPSSARNGGGGQKRTRPIDEANPYEKNE